MIFFLHGKDTHRSRQKLKEIKEKFKRERDATGLNMTVLHGRELTEQLFHQAVATAPFMAKRRMVILENVVTSGSEQLQQAMVAYVGQQQKEQPQECAPILVFWERAAVPLKKVRGVQRTKPRTLTDLLYIQSHQQVFPLLEGRELAFWLQEEIRRRGCTLTAAAQQQLLLWYKQDTWRISQELEKLAAYAQGLQTEAITEDMLWSLSIGEEEVRAFALSDALVQRDAQKALTLLWDHARQGESPFALFGIIARQLHILLLLKSTEHTQQSPRELATILKLHPYVLQKAAQGLSRYTLIELKKNYRRLLAVEKELKSGTRDQYLTISYFLRSALL